MNARQTFVWIAALFALASGLEAEEVQRKLAAAEEGQVFIENTAGLVQVRGWDRSEVEVRGELGSDVEELVFERDGDDVRIEVRTRKGRNRDIDTDLQVMVPAASSVTVGGVSADIIAEGVQGALRLRSVSGDIASRGFGAELDIDTVSGDIDVQGSGTRGYVRLNSVSGDIGARKLAGELDMNTVSGDLEMDEGSWSRVKANSTSGDMELRLQLESGGRLDVETINGDLGIFFTGGVSADFDIESFNGDIRNCFGPKASRTSKYAPGRRLRFTEGEGAGRVTIRTLNGDLEMCND